MQFEQSIQLPVSINTLFQYHASPSALERLLPPNDQVTIRQRSENLEVGARVILRMKIAPAISIDWVAEHVEYKPPTLFADVQRSGPFAQWYHEHRFESLDESHSRLTDHVEYKISRFALLEGLAAGSIARKLKSMFAYRHAITAADLDFAQKLSAAGKRLMVSGASGFLGKRIVAIAQALGIKVCILKRVLRASDIESFGIQHVPGQPQIQMSPWHIESGAIRSDDWQNVDAFIHLAGANIAGKRWTQNYKSVLRSSRVDASNQLVKNLIEQKCLPKTFVTASGVGIYPDANDQLLSEEARSGDDFLGSLARDWEQASQQVQQHGTRWCAGRLGMVLDPQQGALVPLLWQWKLFAGGCVGNGKMYWSWIERDDAARAFLWLAFQQNCNGAFNLSGTAVTNREFAATLSRVLHRPNVLPAPKFAIRLVLGEMADALLLRSNRADNQKLLNSGFPLQYADLESALRHLMT